MALITQTEIIESVRVDNHFSVNNITDDTIQKAELYLSSTFLGDSFYDALVSDKSDVGTFNSAKYQLLYDRYLKRLIAEYVMFMGIDEMVLRLANNGLNNDNELNALKYAKESFRDEVERSKAMLNAYCINNKTDYNLYKENQKETTDEKTKKKSFYGFLSEENLHQEEDKTRLYNLYL